MSELGQRLIEIVRRKAEESPDLVYTPPPGAARCSYVASGQPSCLIGQALWEAGVIRASFEFSAANNKGFSFDLAKHINELYELDPEEFRWLLVVQRKQDGLIPWGEAVSRTETQLFAFQESHG